MTFSALWEEMRLQSIKAGCPVELKCVVSDPEAHVRWFHEENELSSNSGFEMRAEGSTRTLFLECAEPCHSGVYRCISEDDTVEFHVEIQGDFTLFMLSLFRCY